MRKQFDVVVVGGGPAGVGAALAAARNGARTLIIEQHGFLGGCMTLGLPMNVFHDQMGRVVLRGIAEDFIGRLKAVGGSLGHVETRGPCHQRTYTLLDPEIVKYVLQIMLEEAGADILLQAFTTDPVMDDNAVRGVIIVGKSGREVIQSTVVVDCSGDGDIAARAGAPFEKGRAADGGLQAATMMIRVAGVDMAKLPGVFTTGVTLAVKPDSTEPTFYRGQTRFAQWQEAVLREKLFPDGGLHSVFCSCLHDGEVNLNVTRISDCDVSETWDLARAALEGRRQAVAVAQFLKKYVPGFENSRLSNTHGFLGARESRRIIGEYVLTADDVLAGRTPPDSVARGCFPIDIHDPHGKGISQQFVKNDGSYGIPYRCLVPLKVENLLVAGRCLSATHEALGSVRVMGPCMATGEAAGTAAAMGVAQGIPPRRLDSAALQDRLRQQGAQIDEPDDRDALPKPAGFKTPSGVIHL